MLTIRREQFALFSQQEVRKFEDWMVLHLKKFFPGQCETAGDQQIRDLIQHGIRRAARYGITAKKDVAKYVDLMIVLGRNFDSDQQSQWATDILGSPEGASARMQQLLLKAKLLMKNR
jgi:hypothetical protein